MLQFPQKLPRKGKTYSPVQSKFKEPDECVFFEEVTSRDPRHVCCLCGEMEGASASPVNDGVSMVQVHNHVSRRPDFSESEEAICFLHLEGQGEMILEDRKDMRCFLRLHQHDV